MAFAVIAVGDACHGGVYGFAIAVVEQMAAVWAGVVDDGLVLLCAPHGVFELLSNLVYGIQAAFSVDCSSSCLPFLKMTLLTTKVNKLNP